MSSTRPDRVQGGPGATPRERLWASRQPRTTVVGRRRAGLLQDRGKQIVPIHPAAAQEGGLEVLGEKAYPTLADVPFPVDVVDVFRRSSAAGEFADQAVAVGARGVWFQLGVIDEDAFRRTVAAGTPMVMDTCPAIEYRRRP